MLHPIVLLRHAVHQRDLPPAVLDVLWGRSAAVWSGRSRAAVHEVLAAHPHATAAQRQRWATDRRATVRSGAARGTDEPGLLAELAGDDSPTVVERVAANPHTPAEVLAELAAHDQPAVVLAAVANPSCPAETVVASAAAGLEEVMPWSHQLDRTMVWAAVARHPEALHHLVDSPDTAARRLAAERLDTREDGAELAQRLVNDSSLPVRMSLATLPDELVGDDRLPPTALEVRQSLRRWQDGDPRGALADPARRRHGAALGIDIVDRRLAATLEEAALSSGVPAATLAHDELGAALEAGAAAPAPDAVGDGAQAALTGTPAQAMAAYRWLLTLGSERRRAAKRAIRWLDWRHHEQVAVLVERLGGDTHAWATALALSEDWDLGIDALAEQAATLAGQSAA